MVRADPESQNEHLMTKAAEQGIDPHLINEHSGVALPCEGHDMAYLGEKLRCIFGPVIDSNPEARAALNDWKLKA
jgi:hypothetical protein